MRAAVLIFMCVIGVTLALPSFRTKEAQIETRLAGLLDKLLKNGKETRIHQMRSGPDNGLHVDCEGVPFPCNGDYDTWDDEYYECALNTLLSVIPHLSDIYEAQTGEELFSPIENLIFRWYEALGAYDNIGIQIAKFYIGKHRYDNVDWTDISTATLNDIKVNACEGMMVSHTIFGGNDQSEEETTMTTPGLNK